jgi:hypothetical protein
MRGLCIVFIVIAVALPVLGQDEQGWTFSGRLQGSSNSSAFVTKVDPSLGYDFGRHVQTYVGLPFYMVKGSSTTQTPSSFMTGIGNAYAGLRLGVEGEALNFTSTVEATAPTGDKDRGFSTGRVTVDWTNSFSRHFSSVMPFASVGLANTVSDTSFFVRPFTSLGLVSHFDGGALFALSPAVDVGASGYAVKASGEQTIISKVVRDSTTPSTTPTTRVSGRTRVFETNREVLGTAELANDHGFSTWLAARAASTMDFQVGYSRSVGYDFNTVFFGVGFRIGN